MSSALQLRTGWSMIPVSCISATMFVVVHMLWAYVSTLINHTTDWNFSDAASLIRLYVKLIFLVPTESQSDALEVTTPSRGGVSFWSGKGIRNSGKIMPSRRLFCDFIGY
ncbi:hypothetical protein BJ138DRAFT_496496 [Hygrophoropsis aurantiaca]|uniref:Uncharacterized protein n=1 Tax=Hygrophoropsis aurantiaca TaxID=72124 RepID=A0ACB8A2A7_9AGAM|nr:hypothetical protein BJ138DRAFT_496496 [Hygrophoropsis aurantiaca]